ncbi:MAG: DUF5017 domain-containing protein [Chitinophagaceae bacterium]
MNKIIFMLLLFLGVWSCNKKEVEDLSFDVSVSDTAVQVGSDVVFSFSGNPYFITFYSGETGHKYEYRNRTFAEGTPNMSFTSYRQYGTHDSTLKVYVSPDFSGTYTTDGANSASWVNITGRTTLSTGTDNTPSGTVDLSDFVNEDNSPIYVGFRYTETDTTATLRTWTIKNFIVNTILEDSSEIAVATLASAGWTNVNFSNATNIWTITTTGTPQLKIQGGAAGALKNDNMVVSGALYLNKVSPDTGVVIKSISARLDSYTYAFDTAGTYTVTFIGANEDIYGRKESVKSFTIKVSE